MSEPVSIDTIKSPAYRRKLARLCTQYRELNDEIAALQSAKDGLMDEIKPIAQKLKLEKVRGENWTLSKRVTVTKKIVPEKLLEHGVAIKVIEACTDERVSESWQVRGHSEVSDG